MIEVKKINTFSKKNLVLINSKEDFDKIDEELDHALSDDHVAGLNGNQKTLSEIRQDEIYVPPCGQIQTSDSFQKKKNFNSILSHGYYRLRQSLNLPAADKYEPTYSDLSFIKQLKKQYDFDNKYSFKTQTFVDIIESCQHNLHREKTITVEDDSVRILNYLSFKLPSSLTTNFSLGEKKKLSELFLEVIEYWKKVMICREGFPLLRVYWPKTDIAISKYRFWTPFKTRVLSEDAKKPINPYIKHLGQTQRQNKINKQAKDASVFYQQVKKIAQQHMLKSSHFKKQAIKFHKLAGLYGLECPKYLLKVTQCQQRLQYRQFLKKFETSPYFQFPVVKFRHRSRRHLQLHRQFQVSYNFQNNQLNLIQQHSKRQKKEQGNKQNRINSIFRSRTQDENQLEEVSSEQRKKVKKN